MNDTLGSDGTLSAESPAIVGGLPLLWTAHDNMQHWGVPIVDDDGRRNYVALCGASVNFAGRDGLIHDLAAVTCPECARLGGPNRRLDFVRAALRVGHRLGEAHAN